MLDRSVSEESSNRLFFSGLKVGNNDYNLYRDKSFWLLKVNKN